MIELSSRIFVSLPDEVGSVQGAYVVYTAKYPFHKEALGYKGCCPEDSHPEFNVAIRKGYCALNVENSTQEGKVNAFAVIGGLRRAKEVYDSGGEVVFCDNTLEGVAPLAAGVFCRMVGAWDVDYEECKKRLRESIGLFRPKESVVAVMGRVFRLYEASWTFVKPDSEGDYYGLFLVGGLKVEQPIYFDGTGFLTHREDTKYIHPDYWRKRRAAR